MTVTLEQAPSTLLSAEAGSLDHYSRIHQRIAKVNHELHLELLAAHGSRKSSSASQLNATSGNACCRTTSMNATHPLR